MNVKAIIGAVAGGFVALFALTILFGSWYTIDQTERGVILRNGAISGVAQPGLGFKLPLVDSIVKLSVQSHITNVKDLVAYSADQQPATMRISLNYKLLADKTAEIYSNYGSEDGLVQRVILPHLYQETKVVFGRFTAVRAIQERAHLNAQVADAIQKAVEGPVVIQSVQIENIDFSKAYEASIEQRMLAEVDVQKVRQNAEREKVQAEITITIANARATSVLAEARAQADATKLRGDAEASAIRARAAALADNPALVSLVQAERWDGKLPLTMVPGGTLPMMSLGK